jgi:hypothetical protein
MSVRKPAILTDIFGSPQSLEGKYWDKRELFVFYPEDEVGKLIRMISKLLPDNTESHCRRYLSSFTVQFSD